MFCFGINWACHRKTGNRLPKLRGPALFTGQCTVVTELCLPHNSISLPWSLPNTIPQLSLEGDLMAHTWVVSHAFQAGLWRKALVGSPELQMRK